jgi:fructokinase
MWIAGISTDTYGQSARAELLADEVKLDLALTSEKPTCLAIVSLDEAGGARYEFKIEGTATFDFDLNWLPDPAKWFGQEALTGYQVFEVNRQEEMAWEI